MLIRKCLAPEGVDGGGGGGDAGGGAAPARGRMGDFGPLDTGGAPKPSGAPRLGTPRTNHREPIPGDEGLEPIDGDIGATPDDDESALESEYDELGATPDDGQEVDEHDDGSGDGEADFASPVLGMEPAKLLAALRAGVLPKELAEQILDLPDTVVIDGVPYTMTREEMKRAAMRGSDYSRKTTELAELRKQAQGAIAHDAQQWESWAQDPKALWDAMVRRNMCDVTNESGALYEVAMHIADQRRLWLDMSPAEQNAYRAEQRARARELEADERARAAERTAAQQERKDSIAFFQTELARLVPAEFARLQVKHSKLADRLFKEELAIVKDGVPPAEIRRRLPELVREAANNTREHLVTLGRLEKPDARPGGGGQRTQQPARQQQRHTGPLPPTALGGPPPRPGATPPGGRKRMRLGDLTPLYRRGR